MRVSTDPNDPAYIDDRPRRVWCNDVPVGDWAVADEFRRCVITAGGKVLQGSVRIERMGAVSIPNDAQIEVGDVPLHAGFSGGVFVITGVSEAKPDEVFVPPPAAPTPAAPAPTKSAKRRR